MKTAVSAAPPPGQVLPAPLVQGFGTIWRVRAFLVLQIVIFLSMVSIHFGLLIAGYRQRSAGTTELVIAAVLVAGLLLTWTPPPWNRRSATAAQSFGNLGNDALLWLPVRWVVGLVGPFVLAGMAWQTARLRSTQSATGILYVVVICCFIGELTGQVLRDSLFPS